MSELFLLNDGNLISSVNQTVSTGGSDNATSYDCDCFHKVTPLKKVSCCQLNTYDIYYIDS